MMKKLLILLFAVSAITCTKLYSQKSDLKINNDLSKFGIKGNVKSFFQYDCNFTQQSGKTKSTGVLSKNFYLFTPKEKIAEKKFYDVADIVISRYTFKYDTSGKMTESTDSSSTYPFTYKQVYIYDKLGNETEYIGYNSDYSIKTKIIYLYDTAGREIENQVYDGSLPDSKTITSYDKYGLYMEAKYYTSTGEYDGKTGYNLDSSGYVTAKKNYDSNFKLKGNYTYSYDENGNLTRYEDIDDIDDLFGFEINTYDSLGRKIQKYEMTSWDGKKTNDYYLYDEKDNVIYDKQEVVGSYNTIIYSYEYVYDTKGNWTEKIEYKDKSPMTFTKREISYY
jgi:hypothetical protein